MNPISLTASRRKSLPRLLRSLVCLLCLVGLSRPGLTQTPTDWSPEPPEGASSIAGEAVDPPARIGRIAWVSGPVELSNGAQPWRAELNWPVSAGQMLVTGRAGQVELRIASASVRLAGDSELWVRRLDDESVALELRRGTLSLTARNREWIRDLQLTTPRARVELLAPGRYRLEAGSDFTRLGVAHGEARLLAQRMSFTVRAGESGNFVEAPQSYPSFQISAWRADALDDWAAARDLREEQAISARHVSSEMPGVEVLDDYGHWQTLDEFGSVWFPNSVAVGWAPYRSGRWAWISPWGWTWIDTAPWGFAPFHYGRWVWWGGRWGWAPGRWHARPVYAPALVVWQGPAGRAGWVPLAPGEAYRPWYRNSPGSYGRINRHQAPTEYAPPARYRHETRASTWVRAGEPGRPQHPAPPGAFAAPPAHETMAPGDGRKQLPRPLPVPETRPRPGEDRRQAGHPGAEPGWASRAVQETARGGLAREPAAPRPSFDSRPEARPEPRFEHRNGRERLHQVPNPAPRPQEPGAAPTMRIAPPPAPEPRRGEADQAMRRPEPQRKPEADSPNEPARPGERQRRMMQ